MDFNTAFKKVFLNTRTAYLNKAFTFFVLSVILIVTVVLTSVHLSERKKKGMKKWSGSTRKRKRGQKKHENWSSRIEEVQAMRKLRH